MKNAIRLFGIIALTAVIGFTFSACDDNSGGGDIDLTGNISISPNTGVTTGMELTANYTGSETVAYQWKKDGTNVGTNLNKHTPAEAGSYTVTVSATGYNSKTSTAVNVTGATLANLTGNITISPNTGVTTGMELTANYSGSETVAYQWKKDGTDVGSNSNKFTPNETGSYTVTVSASGYNSKTSDAVNVTGAALTNLTGNITISPNTDVTTGIVLTANYTGSETVAYQWKKNGTNVGTNLNKHTPTEAGSYTVTVSATGYNSKTSDAVTVRTATAGLDYTLINDDTEYSVSSGTATDTEVVIPAFYNGKPVTAIIGFGGYENMTSVTIS